MFGMLHDEGIEIRRELILEDAYKILYPRQEAIKDRLRI
jgi:hypothetical protein